MGVYDKVRDKFCTVAKCGNGHDDATLARLQKELDMVKISKVECTKIFSSVQCHYSELSIANFIFLDIDVS